MRKPIAANARESTTSAPGNPNTPGPTPVTRTKRGMYAAAKNTTTATMTRGAVGARLRSPAISVPAPLLGVKLLCWSSPRPSGHRDRRPNRPGSKPFSEFVDFGDLGRVQLALVARQRCEQFFHPARHGEAQESQRGIAEVGK